MAQLRKIINLGVVPEDHIASYNRYSALVVSDNVKRCHYKAYFIDYEYIGEFGSKEAESVLYAHNETDPRVIAYEIIGDNHFDTEVEDDGYGGEREIEVDSDTPEFYLVFDANKKLVSSFFYDTENPGGERLEGEHIYEQYEIAWTRKEYRDYTFDPDNEKTWLACSHDVIIPVIIAGKPSLDFLSVYHSGSSLVERAAIGELCKTPRSLTEVRDEIKNGYNDGLDTLIYSPLLWLNGYDGIVPRAAWIAENCRYMFLPANILRGESK